MTEAENIPPEQHVHPDDPRYDGFRIKEYWALTMLGEDNQEGMIWVDTARAIRYHMISGPGMASDERRLLHLRDLARDLVKEHGVELRIRHFVVEGEDEVFSP